MDWTTPLRSLAPTLDATVLEVLAGTERGLGAGQIARSGGRGTRQGIALAIDRLVTQGLVIAWPTNRGHMYTLNRDHVLADAVLQATGARDILLERLRASFGNLTPVPLHASVFGSFARHEAGPTSDIDVLVVTPQGAPHDDAWYDQLHQLGQRVQAWSGNRLEYLTFTHEELGRTVHRHEPIVDSWLADCVTVFGMPIDTLVKDARTRRRAARRQRG